MQQLRTIIRLFICVIIGSISAKAQSDHFGGVGLHFQVGIPVGEFKNTNDQVGLGVGGDLFFRLQKELPLFVGIHLNYINFDSYTKEFNVNVLGFPKRYKLNASTNLFSGFGGIRYAAELGIMRPYVEGLIGFKNFYIRKSLDEYQTNSPEDEKWRETDSETKGATTFSYGGSVGLGFYIKKAHIAIDMKCQYLQGGSLTFFKKKEVISDEEFAKDAFSVYEPVTTRTDMVIPQLGFIYYFSKE